ncbi:hypothetical protein J6590_036218 [Homalodisca vitripennis]|nr:hypothetical protein J6590_036218 [Homalodisca vitripennis]
MNKYKHVFEGLGKVKGEVNLEITNGGAPKQQAPRRVPVALKNALPYYPQSNGKAEVSVRLAKDIIKKVINEKTDFYKMLLLQRITQQDQLPSTKNVHENEDITSERPWRAVTLPRGFDDYVMYRVNQASQQTVKTRRCTPSTLISWSAVQSLAV